MISNLISREELDKAEQLFNDCKNVVITTHTSSDGDAIGSSLALYEYLKSRGKQVTVIVPNYYPSFLHWMTDADKIIEYDKHKGLAHSFINGADLICCLDLNEPSRLSDLSEPIVNARAKKLMIDHHLNCNRFCDVIISYPHASSTSELVFRLINALGGLKKLTKAGAEDIFAGICTDTGRLSFNSNNPDLFRIIAELIEKGIDKDKIIRNIYNNYTEGRFRMLGHVLYNKLRVFPEQGAAYYSLSKEEQLSFNFKKGDAEGLVNMPLEIKGIHFSISLREDTEKPVVWISLRSVDDFTVNDIAARYFNGGGHKNAAGGHLDCSLEEAINLCEKVIKELNPETIN